MKFTILMGSPRLQGNTAVLCRPFVEELKWCGAEVRYITLADKQILPCRGCYACQNVQGQYGCVLHDDMQQIADDLIWSDCIVLAAPIYAWYCPTSMKLVLDRHYGLNKFYGTAQGSLWAGKRLALLLTHGYEREYATQPFVLGMQRLCEHSNLQYCGMYSVRDTDGPEVFRSPEAERGAREFARTLAENRRVTG
ncbi:MAG: NAD(P)H-dependent oxidoreductase [Clostridiaceae bacterium]|nr:NAD(P)H-dependent oxidoreductase [Clostridiaceae bacterium]